MEEKDGKIPLGLCKQASLKLESFISDVYEIIEDPDLTDSDRDDFKKMAEIAGWMEAHIINIINGECEETIFLSEDIPMDQIGSYPGDEIMTPDDDLLDQEI